jgi:hypothetical protein
LPIRKLIVRFELGMKMQNIINDKHEVQGQMLNSFGISGIIMKSYMNWGEEHFDWKIDRLFIFMEMLNKIVLSWDPNEKFCIFSSKIIIQNFDIFQS